MFKYQAILNGSFKWLVISNRKENLITGRKNLLTMMQVALIVILDVLVAGRGVVPLATVMVMMMVMVMAMVMMRLALPSMLVVTVVVIQRGGGSRGGSEPEPPRASRRAAGPFAQSRRCFERLHLRFHQSSEDGFETCHLHSAATIVRRDCLVSDIGSRRSDRHLSTDSRHITLTIFDGDHFATGSVAGLVGSPLTELSRDLLAIQFPLLPFPFLRYVIH